MEMRSSGTPYKLGKGRETEKKEIIQDILTAWSRSSEMQTVEEEMLERRRIKK